MASIIKVFLLAMTPIGELRAAIPAGLGVFHLGLGITYLVSVIGNLVPLVFLLLFLDPISSWLSRKSKTFERLFDWLFERTRRKYKDRTEKWGNLALAFFVAIPLPLTGGWTGSLAAFLFDIPFRKAFPLITTGVVIAGIIVTALTKIGIAVEEYFGWQILIGIILAIGFFYAIYKIKSGFATRVTPN